MEKREGGRSRAAGHGRTSRRGTNRETENEGEWSNTNRAVRRAPGKKTQNQKKKGRWRIRKGTLSDTVRNRKKQKGWRDKNPQEKGTAKKNLGS